MNESLIEVDDDNHTDRISINQKDEEQENNELTFNQVKNFHKQKKTVDGSGGAITGVAGQEELPEDMKQ